MFPPVYISVPTTCVDITGQLDTNTGHNVET